MKKKLLSLALVAALAVSTVACSSSSDNKKDGDKGTDLKIGVILIGDETEGYTLAHMDGIKAAASELNIPEENIVWKKSVPESDECTNAASDLVANGCSLIISNSYGHQDYMVTAAQENSDADFVSMTGDFAAISGTSNFYNAFTDVYESRFVSGVVAGMKIAELVEQDKIPATGYDKDGNVKVGYVGAFPYAEVVSGYTAFYLGIKSVYPKAVMSVTYTNSWFDIEAEGAAAESLMAEGCVIIGQHADSTGAPSAIQAAQEKNNAVAYSIGYNVDMLDVAPTAALTSATNNWAEYYKVLFQAKLDGKEIPQDWSEGYSAKAVGITKLGESAAAGTDAKVAEVEKALADGTLKVFDTANFTVGGEKVTTAPCDMSYMDFTTMTPIYEGKTEEAIVTEGDVSYFAESTFRAAPYFTLRIDGITEENAK